MALIIVQALSCFKSLVQIKMTIEERTTERDRKFKEFDDDEADGKKCEYMRQKRTS